MANYFDHLLSLDTPTYTVAQIAKRFEPSAVLWAFHTIQQSSFNRVSKTNDFLRSEAITYIVTGILHCVSKNVPPLT